MLRTMEKDIDVWTPVSQGNLTPVNDWLREKIHRHGRILKPHQLLENACGCAFDPTVNTDYLKEKFARLYHL